MRELDAARRFGSSVLVKCSVKSHQRPEVEEGRWVRGRPQVFRAATQGHGHRQAVKQENTRTKAGSFYKAEPSPLKGHSLVIYCEIK